MKVFQPAASSSVAVYRKHPSPKNLAARFRKAQNQIHEEILIDSDDHEWKRNYRKDNFYGVSEIDININPGARLSIGVGAFDPPEIIDLMQIFYGRVPLRLDVPVGGGGEVKFRLFDIPWLIALPRDSVVSINGLACTPHRSRAAGFNLIGQGDLDKLGLLGEHELHLKTKCMPPEMITFYYRINALALNAGTLSLEMPSTCTILAR